MCEGIDLIDHMWASVSKEKKRPIKGGVLKNMNVDFDLIGIEIELGSGCHKPFHLVYNSLDVCC